MDKHPPAKAIPKWAKKNNKPSEKDKKRIPEASLSLAHQELTSPPDLSPYSQTLHKLDLTSCSLSKLDWVQEAKRTLTWLNVSENDLSGTDAWNGVDQLQTLFVLNASSCSLTRVPSVVAKITSLKALVLSHNALKTVDHLTPSHTALNSVILSHNALTSLPHSITHLSSLAKLSLSHNSLTADALPDLSSCSRLREVRLNNNPLVTLPDHFATWGRSSSSTSAASSSDNNGRGKGLQIVELSSCQFSDWTAIKPLAAQSGIVNLGLKGNPVADDALREEHGGFEAFKQKMTILLPLLRVLDAQRFDAKYSDLKAKREARPIEQKIIDAGPMALAANNASDNPVRLVALEKSRGKKRRRREQHREVTAGESEEETKDSSKDEPKHQPKKRRSTDPEDVDTNEMDEPNEKAHKKKKKKKENLREEVDDDKSKARSADSKDDVITRDSNPNNSGGEPRDELPIIPRRKRGRRSKYIEELKKKYDMEQPGAERKADKEKKQRGAVLDVLKGDYLDKLEKRQKPSSVPPPEAPYKEEQGGKEDRAKTSVVNIIEVKKKKNKKELPQSEDIVKELLSAPKKEEASLAALAGWD